MPVFTSSIEVTADYPTIKPSLNLNFAKSRALDSRITFTRSTIATYIDRNGLVKYAGVNEPRFDHDPLTGESLGLLLEETRTNIFRNSDFSGGTTDWTIGSWDTNNLSYGTENVVLPTGETGPAWYVERLGNSSSAHWHQNYHSYPTNTRVAWSVWGKGEGTFNMRRLSGWTVISTNASDYGDANNSTSFTLSPTEWRRFVLIMDAGGSVGYPYFASESQTPNVRCHYWGAQIEVGQFVSSFIKSPTGGGASRSYDNAEIIGENFTDNFNTLEGTFVAECDRGNDGTEGAGIGAMRALTNSYFDMVQFGEFYDNGGATGRVYIGGTSQAQVGATHTTGQGVYNRYAFAYKKDSFAGAVNGVGQGEDTSGNVPTILAKFLFGGYNDDRSTQNLDGHIKYLHYYPQRLTNAQLQLLTA